MDTAQALFYSENTVKNILTSAGFVNGLTLTRDELKAEERPIFWYINVGNKDASEKETYITYSIVNIECFSYGDGVCITQKATIKIDVFSRKKYINDIIRDLDNTFSLNGFSFKLNDVNYDANIELYNHSFIVEALVEDDGTY